MRNLVTLLFLFLPFFSYGFMPLGMTCFDPSELKDQYGEKTVFFDSRNRMFTRRDEFILAYQSGKIPHADLKHFQILNFQESTPLKETLASLMRLLKDNKSKNYISLLDSDFLNGVSLPNPEHQVCLGDECMLAESLQDDRDYTFLDLNQGKNMKPSELAKRLRVSSLSGYHNIFVFKLKPGIAGTNSPVEKYVRRDTDGNAYIDMDKVKEGAAVKEFSPVRFIPKFCEGSVILRIPRNIRLKIRGTGLVPAPATR